MLPKRKLSGGDGDSFKTVIHGQEGGPSPGPASSPFTAPRHNSMKTSSPNITEESSVKETENPESGLKAVPFSHAVSNHKTSSIETGFSHHEDTGHPSASPFAGLSTATSSPVQDGSEGTIDREVSRTSPDSGIGNLGEKDSDGDQHTVLSHDAGRDSSSERNHSIDDSLSSGVGTWQDQDSSGGSSDGSINDFLDSGEDDEEDNSKPKKWPWIVAIVVLILLVAGVGAGVWFSTHDKPVKLDNSSKVSGSKINTGGDDSSDDTSNLANKEKQFLESIGVPKFYQQDKDSLSKEQVADANEYALATEPQNAVGRFMSKDSNPDLTDDPSQYLLKDGSINPNYSYLTADNTTAVIRDDMERLVNPVYGGWDFLQSDIRQDFDGYAQPFDSLSIADMFDPSVPLANEAEVRENAKLYADWDSNSYGGEWKNLESPIVGQIVDYNCDYNVAGSEGDTISCTAQVKYTGKVKNDDGKIQDKSVDKTLKLNYKVVYDGTNASSRRILLTSVEQ